MPEPLARVLIVDDEDALRFAVKRILEYEGYEVETAENGVGGIEMVVEHDYDLALIDLKMPDISGIDVLKEVRRLRPNTICFMATAYASYDTAIQATRLGAFGYILKPFTDDELLHQLNQGLEKRRLLIESERMKKDREERLLELAFERSRLNTIINLIADGVLVVNRNGEVVYYNPAAIKYFLLEEIHIQELIAQRLPAEVASIINDMLAAEQFEDKSQSVQVEIMPNRELYIEVTCSPIPHHDKTIAGIVIVVRNITSFKEIEHIKSQFVSMVSHELKAPIAATLGFLNLMMNPEVILPPEKQLDFLKRSSTRLTGLLTMVNDLLDISRMEMNSVTRELKPLSMPEVIREVVSFHNIEIEKKQLTVEYDFPEKLPELVADQLEIQRLITNLVSNSIKYNKQGGKIFIGVQASQDFLFTTIRDTGIGMKPEECNRLFTEFFRAKNEFTKGIHGTGLGMSIVKRILDSYSGTIKVESEYGAGTTFTIKLPCRKE